MGMQSQGVIACVKHLCVAFFFLLLPFFFLFYLSLTSGLLCLWRVDNRLYAFERRVIRRFDL